MLISTRLRRTVSLITAMLLALSLTPPQFVSAAGGASVIATISSAPSRSGILGVNPTTNKVYVSRDDPANAQGINVINANTNTIATIVSSPSGFHAGLSVNTATNRIYVSQQFASSILVINGATDTVIGSPISIPSTQTVAFNAVDPPLNRLYVIRPNDGDIALVNTQTNTFVQAVAAGCCDQQSALAVDVASHLIYVANRTSNTVKVIRHTDFATVATIPMPGGAFRAAVHQPTQRVYVTHHDLDFVSVIDGRPGSPTQNTVIDTIPIGLGGFGVTIDATANRVYVSRTTAQELVVIHTGTNSVIDRTANVPNGSASLGVIPALHRVYASDDGTQAVRVVEDLGLLLTVTKAGTGTGKVESTAPATTPPGIDCGEDCAESYAPGTNVTLTATPDAGFQFTGWSGCTNPPTNPPGPCQVTMNAAKTVTATFRPIADLAAGMTESADPAKVGNSLTYTVTAMNLGPAASSNVTMTDTLPLGLTFGSATPSQGTCSNTTLPSGQVRVTCALGSLANGASATVAIAVTPTSAAATAGSITNMASVSSSVTADPVNANSTGRAQTTVIP